ncbi:hypothetical protein CAPI_05200 [Corynebacterium capitovis DSM 44611]|uniref:YbjN domain-containing protein n=1 Tax=Corynebacterium capitovis TaxID=131081 RepID=UPI00035C90E8|nr:YbjN domain-containing protein [Corynebacterium capitovis]WKD57591.1 hypothetical protein CAPI_05200 [Corynebacterium capitovis DSM 44611]
MSTNAPVTVDRIIAAASDQGISLVDDPTGRVARGRENDLDLLFVLLDSVLIVRADTSTEVPSNSAQAQFYLAANQINSGRPGPRAIVANRGDTLVMRAEAELPVTAGLTDEQLATALSEGVGSVVRTQDGFRALL